MLGVNAVFTAGRVIAEGVAQMPVRLIEGLPGGRTRIASEHSAHRLIAKKTNSWITPCEFKEGMTFAASNAPAAIAPAKPAGEDYPQKAVGAYVIGLHEAHADRHSKLGAVRGALSK